jgi:hypothetical protein
MLFIAWWGTNQHTGKGYFGATLTCLYYDYEQYVRNLGERLFHVIIILKG